MEQLLFSALSPGGAGGRLSSLIFHRVLPEPDPLFPGEVDAKRFDTICGWVRNWFNVLPLTDAVLRLRDGTLPARALAITFDDGYADNRSVALPILQRHGLTATFFIATGYLDGGRMWNDTIIEAVRRTRKSTIDLSGLGGAGLGEFDLGSDPRKREAIDKILRTVKYLDPAERVRYSDRLAALAGAQLPHDLMMTSSEVRELRLAGMQIGAHTVSHPILAVLSDDEARIEIFESRRVLEQITGEQVTVFAYPNGRPGEDYVARDVLLARECGFAAAMSTAWGAANRASDPFQLPRFTPWSSTRMSFAAHLARNLRRSQ